MHFTNRSDAEKKVQRAALGYGREIADRYRFFQQCVHTSTIGYRCYQQGSWVYDINNLAIGYLLF